MRARAFSASSLQNASYTKTETVGTHSAVNLRRVSLCEPRSAAAGDHQRAPFAGLKRELTPVSWGKMARCSKAIFRVRWGLSESGLMAAGDLPALLGASHRKTATGVSPIAHPVLLQRRKAAVWRRKCRPGVEEKMPRFVPANPDREETSQGQGAPLRTLEADLPSPGREERGTPRRERAQRLF